MEVIGTGLSGLIGSRVVELLPTHKFFDVSLESKINILDTIELDKFFKEHPESDTVIHFAAFTDTNAAWLQKGDKNGDCWKINVEGTKNILDLCKKYSKYLILISTDYVFNGTKTTPYLETDTPNPLDWYGETKYEAEKMVLNSSHPGAVVRISYPYRAQFKIKTDLIRKIITKLQKSETVNLFEDQIITPTFIDDVAYGLEKIIQQKPNGIFHLVSSSYQSVYQTGLDIASVFNFDNNLIKPTSLTEYLKTPNTRPYSFNGALSNEYTRKLLVINMHSFANGLAEMKSQIDSRNLNEI